MSARQGQVEQVVADPPTHPPAPPAAASPGAHHRTHITCAGTGRWVAEREGAVSVCRPGEVLVSLALYTDGKFIKLTPQGLPVEAATTTVGELKQQIAALLPLPCDRRNSRTRCRAVSLHQQLLVPRRPNDHHGGRGG